jgi:hypothetical protein
MDALESSRVVVRRLAVGDELVADAPLGIQRDTPGRQRRDLEPRREPERKASDTRGLQVTIAAAFAVRSLLVVSRHRLPDASATVWT